MPLLPTEVAAIDQLIADALYHLKFFQEGLHETIRDGASPSEAVCFLSKWLVSNDEIKREHLADLLAVAMGKSSGIIGGTE